MDEAVSSDAPVVDAAEELETTTPEEVLAITGHEAPTEEASEDEEQEEAAAEEAAAEEPEASEEGAEEEEAAEEAAEVEEPATAAPEAPSFAVEVEDASGNTVTINPGDNLEEVLADFEPKNNGQVFQIIKDVMAQESAKEAFDKEQAEHAEAEAHEAQIAEISAGWDKEIAELTGAKRLADGDDGKGRVEAVFTFMAEENVRREQANKPLIQSFEDALDKLELREKNEAEVAKKKEAKEAARKRGGMVGGSSAPAAKGGPQYAGGARTANEALSSMGLL